MSDPFFKAPSPEYLAALLPQYAIEFFVAQGGMGAVYKGCQRSLERDVAIKVLPTEMGKDPQFRESFDSEAKAMARLNHPNLIAVFDFGNVGGMPYIVMEYVHGKSLHASAWNRVVEPSQAVAIVKGICDGLTHAHENGIVHRDIKPSNILLTQRAEPKIGDFGLAHAADSETPGLVMGTPGYTAPEVFEDPDLAGPLADLYAVGVILHQLLTGIDPAGSEGPPTQTTGIIRLDAIWRKATQVDPAQRYASVAAMAAELEKWAATKAAVPSSSTGPVPTLTSGRRAVVLDSGGGGFLWKGLFGGAVVAGMVFAVMSLQEKPEGVSPGVVGVSETEVVEPVASTPQPEVFLSDPVPIEPAEVAGEDEPLEVAMLDSSSSDLLELPEWVPEIEREPEVELEPGDPDLRERAVGLIVEARWKRDKKLTESVDNLRFNLEIEARGAWAAKVSLIKSFTAAIVDGRVPRVEGVDGLDADLVKIFEAANAKEESIDEGYRSELVRIRDAYVARLEGAAGEEDEEELKERLLAQAERAKDWEEWVQLLSPEPEVVKKMISGDFAGNWEIDVDGKLSRWVAHPGGKVEVVGEEWEAMWEIMGDGSLEVRFEDKKPYVFKRDGDGWTGKTAVGKPASLSRGEW